MLTFGVLARKWPKIMRRWELIEIKLPKYRTQKEKRKLAYHLKMLAFIVLLSSLSKSIDAHSQNEFIPCSHHGFQLSTF